MQCLNIITVQIFLDWAFEVLQLEFVTIKRKINKQINRGIKVANIQKSEKYAKFLKMLRKEKKEENKNKDFF